MAFIGTPLDTRNTFQSLQGKRFNGDGSTTDFTLDVTPSSTLDCDGETLKATIRNNLKGDFSLVTDLEQIDQGAFVVMDW